MYANGGDADFGKGRTGGSLLTDTVDKLDANSCQSNDRIRIVERVNHCCPIGQRAESILR
jgi:hypothetical protein